MWNTYPNPEMDKTPVEILEAFIEVKPEPEPTKLEADKVLDVLFHDKFEDCNNALVPFPINI